RSSPNSAAVTMMVGKPTFSRAKVMLSQTDLLGWSRNFEWKAANQQPGAGLRNSAELRNKKAAPDRPARPYDKGSSPDPPREARNHKYSGRLREGRPLNLLAVYWRGRGAPAAPARGPRGARAAAGL